MKRIGWSEKFGADLPGSLVGRLGEADSVAIRIWDVEQPPPSRNTASREDTK